MIVLDTNVLSELMRGEPDENVREWTDSGRLHITALTLAEIGYGIARSDLCLARGDAGHSQHQ